MKLQLGPEYKNYYERCGRRNSLCCCTYVSSQESMHTIFLDRHQRLGVALSHEDLDHEVSWWWRNKTYFQGTLSKLWRESYTWDVGNQHTERLFLFSTSAHLIWLHFLIQNSTCTSCFVSSSSPLPLKLLFPDWEGFVYTENLKWIAHEDNKNYLSRKMLTQQDS